MLVVTFFYTEVTAVVARLIVAVILYICLGYLADISEYISCRVIRIFAQNTFLNEKSGVTVKFLLQFAVVFGRQVSDQSLRSV